MARVDNLSNFLSDVADAIREKKGTSGTITASDFDTEIQSIPTGGGTTEVEENDVNFYDYDGTITNSYTKDEFLSLLTMPENPTHEGLTAQGWNWTLEDAQTFVRQYGVIDIGQMYITDDGDTRIYIELTDTSRLLFYMRIQANGTVQVDWGDNTTPDTYTGTNVSTSNYLNHTYSTIGKYVIKITLTAGTSYALPGMGGTYQQRSLILCHAVGGNQYEYYTSGVIYKIELGSNIDQTTTLKKAMFSDLINLETITIPSYMILDGAAMFYQCYKLKFLTVPNINTSVPNVSYCFHMKHISLPKETVSVTAGSFSGCNYLERLIFTNISNNLTSSIGSNMFELHHVIFNEGINDIRQTLQGCRSVEKIYLPNTMTAIRDSAFRECLNLTYIKIPASVTTIGSYVFYNCYSFGTLDMSEHTSIPTLGSQTFTNVTTYKIVVPDELYDDWIVATNWSTYASKIIKKSEWDAM